MMIPTRGPPLPARKARRISFQEGYSAGSWRRPPAWTTYVPLDHLRAVGPLKCGWTTWFTKYGGPTERKWSNRTQVVQAGRPRHDMRDAVPPCGTRRRGGAGGAGTAPAPPGPPPDDRPADPAAPNPPPAHPEATRAPSRPAPRPGALDNPSHHTLGTRSEPLPEQPSSYRLPEIRPGRLFWVCPGSFPGGDMMAHPRGVSWA